MRNNGRPKGKIEWTCAVKKRASNLRAQNRYVKTEKGQATERRYRTSPQWRLVAQLKDLVRVRY